MKKVVLGSLAGVAGLMAIASPAAAQSVSGRMDVQLEVVPGCAFVGGAGSTPTTGGVPDAVLSFGRTTGDVTTRAAADSSVRVDGVAVSSADGTALRIVCSSSVVAAGGPQLSFDAGLNGASGQRNLIGPGGALVPYNLYKDAGRYNALVADTAETLADLTAGVAKPYNVYGRITNAGLSGITNPLADGVYTDTVTMTLAF
ncbi:spore coat protein U domain-containing protein [Sphingomonas fennica]|nr:spore coat protein U domain-containing protein [Sphingomonas fennica]